MRPCVPAVPPLIRIAILAAMVALLARPALSRAGGHTFPLTYTPWLDRAGESEVELWVTSKHGKQDPAEGATLESRAEWEYTLTPRLAVAAYLNVVRPPGGSVRYASSSIEFIAPVTKPGHVAGDPAFYLEATESGEELELEPKLLLGARIGRWVAATNLGAELEFRHNDDEHLPTGAILRNAIAGQITAGLVHEFGRSLALGIEARGRTEHPNYGPRAAALVSLGPCLKLEAGRAGLAIGVFPQLRGFPRTSGGLNLVDFEKAEVRAVVGFEL